MIDGWCAGAVGYLGFNGDMDVAIAIRTGVIKNNMLYVFCLELALRPGVQHSARETDFNLERVLPMAQRLSAGSVKGRSWPGLIRAWTRLR